MTIVIKKINGVSFPNIKKLNGIVKNNIKKVAGVSRGHQYWRFYQTGIVGGYTHSPRLCELKWVDGNGNTITPTSYSYGGTWLTGENPDVTPPFDGVTNTSDQGWIHNNDAWVSAYFAIPRLFSSFGAFTSYGGGRGGYFNIQYSDDGTNWTTITNWQFVSNSGTGWYTTNL